MDPDSSSYLTLILGILFLSLFFSGFISAYEAALGNLSHLRLQKRAEEGDARSAYLLNLLNHPHRTLLTLMLSDWLADVTVLVLTAWLVFQYTDSLWALPVVALLLTPVLLILGEVIPKAIAVQFEDRFVYAWLPLLKLLLAVFSLPVSLMTLVTRPFLDLLGARLGQIVPDFTEEEILQMVNMGGNTGLLDKQETELVQHALIFDDTPASAVLTPRVDMVCIEESDTVNEALNIMAGEEGYSRLPVYRDNLDNIVGMVYIKDLLRLKQHNAEVGDYPVASYLRKVHHVHEYQSIDVVLREMQTRRMPLFIVTDEYGGTVGLITMEDLLEQIVGEIHDEFDQDEVSPIEILDAHTLLVDARVSVSDINEALDLDLPNGQSVAGLVFSTLGEAPRQGEMLRIEGAELCVEAIEGIRIVQVRVHKLTPEELQLERSKAKPDERHRTEGDQTAAGRRFSSPAA
ncbi:MAG: HlyC/CorC family transporter [Candidatus Sericytochromatia bacterium]|nr:HlyC/CorC family transporter [Candidatus Sericytochromatia bacterium]